MAGSAKGEATKKHRHFRVGGWLHRETSVHDELGNLLHRVVEPVMFEFYPRDVLQTIVGATLLAVPMAFTDEVWRFGAELSTVRTIVIVAFSLTAIAMFVYYNIYRAERGEGFEKMVERGHLSEYVKRVISTYVIALLISLLILILLDKAAFGEHFAVTIRRAVLLALPASMSAAVVDILK